MKKFCCFLAFLALIASTTCVYAGQSSSRKATTKTTAEKSVEKVPNASELLKQCYEWEGGRLGEKHETLPCRTISELSKFVAPDILRKGGIVIYSSKDGKIVYKAEPVPNYNSTIFKNCISIRERVFIDWIPVIDTVKEVCGNPMDYNRDIWEKEKKFNQR